MAPVPTVVRRPACKAPGVNPALASSASWSASGRAGGGTLRNHLLEFVLASCLVRLDKCRRAPVELIGLGFCLHLFEFRGLGADGRNVSALLVLGKFFVGLKLHQALVGFEHPDRNQL